MKLVVGLGNPGSEYANNRHNIGFMVADELIQRWNGSSQSRFRGEFARVSIQNVPAVVLKPMTYMNRSGESVEPCAHFFKVAPEDVIVVHDELDIPFGRVRVKVGGGHAGHNGLKSIIAHGGPDFVRLRVGIGRPPGPTVEHVLSDFDPDEVTSLETIIQMAADAVETIIAEGTLPAMNQFNKKSKKKAPAPSAANECKSAEEAE